jgi:hypothetical protein
MMSFIRFFFLLILIFATSCSNSEGEQTAKNSPVSTMNDYSEFQMITLDKIIAGPKFELHIEDFGDYKDRMANKKKELTEQHKFFQIKYLIDEPQLLLYERKLIVNGDKNAAPEVGFDHITYHVYGEKILDGITYELRSKDAGFSADQKYIAEMMAKTIKSFNKLGK